MPGPTACAARLRRFLLGTAALLPSLLPAQQPLPADLDELARMVDAAHKTDAASPITGFAADLRIEELAQAAAEHRGQIELSVAFLDWRNPQTDRPYPLIRYRRRDSAHSVEQGRDREDYWSVTDGQPQNMRSRELQTDLEHARRNIKLARQMIQFADPGAVLRNLQSPKPIVEETLTVGRAQKTPCYVATGRLESFPMVREKGEDVPVLAKAYVAKDSSLLLALEVQPLDRPEDAEKGEFLLLSRHEPHAGRIVPKRLVHFALEEGGKRRVQLGIDLLTLDLGKDLTPKDVDRPK